MPGYRVVVLPPARRALRSIDARSRTGIMGIIANLRANPRPLGCRPLTGHRPYLRLRIGDYRIIYAVDDAARLVTVVVAGHRRDIYRNLNLP